MIWGVAFCLDPREWRFGKSAALADDGRQIGWWYCLGPVAITKEWE